MKEIDLPALHESLGDEYIEVCRAHGIPRPPVVMWSTSADYRTVCFICFDDGRDDFVSGFPTDMLVSEVVRRVLEVVGSGN